MESRLRFCQNSLGDVVVSSGDDWNGEESVLRVIFYTIAVSGNSGRGLCLRHDPLTLEGCLKLGEFRLRSEGESSERGRGMPVLALVGGGDPGVLLPLLMRKGCTCRKRESQSRETRYQGSGVCQNLRDPQKTPFCVVLLLL